MDGRNYFGRKGPESVTIFDGFGHGTNYYISDMKKFDEIIANYSCIAKSKNAGEAIKFLREIAGNEFVDFIKNYYYNSIVNSQEYIVGVQRKQGENKMENEKDLYYNIYVLGKITYKRQHKDENLSDEELFSGNWYSIYDYVLKNKILEEAILKKQKDISNIVLM